MRRLLKASTKHNSASFRYREAVYVHVGFNFQPCKALEQKTAMPEQRNFLERKKMNTRKAF